MRLTEKSFGGVYGKKLERGHYATNTECMNRLFDLENSICDEEGNEIIGLDRLRELASAERDGRLVVLPEVPNCEKRSGKFCGNHTEEDEDRAGHCLHCCLLCDHAKEMDCTFVCETAASHFNPPDEAEAKATSALTGKHDGICTGCSKLNTEICESCLRNGHGNDVDFFSAGEGAV